MPLVVVLVGSAPMCRTSMCRTPTILSPSILRIMRPRPLLDHEVLLLTSQHLSEVQGEDVVVHAVVVVGVVLQLIVIWLQLMHLNQQLPLPQLHMDGVAAGVELLQLDVAGVVLEQLLLNSL